MYLVMKTANRRPSFEHRNTSFRNMAASHLSPALMAELKATADAMSAPCKGFLAADESAGPWLRAGHVEAKKIEDTAENRAAYRAMCFTTPGLSQYVSGVILHWETLFQKDGNGKQLVDMIKENGEPSPSTPSPSPHPNPRHPPPGLLPRPPPTPLPSTYRRPHVTPTLTPTRTPTLTPTSLPPQA